MDTSMLPFLETFPKMDTLLKWPVHSVPCWVGNARCQRKCGHSTVLPRNNFCSISWLKFSCDVTTWHYLVFYVPCMNQYQPFLWPNVYFIIMHAGCECVWKKKTEPKWPASLHKQSILKSEFQAPRQFFCLIFSSCSSWQWLIWCCSAQTHSYQSYIRKH